MVTLVDEALIAWIRDQLYADESDVTDPRRA
jgi:hypothetical protein